MTPSASRVHAGKGGRLLAGRHGEHVGVSELHVLVTERLAFVDTFDAGVQKDGRFGGPRLCPPTSRAEGGFDPAAVHFFLASLVQQALERMVC